MSKVKVTMNTGHIHIIIIEENFGGDCFINTHDTKRVTAINVQGQTISNIHNSIQSIFLEV